MHATGYMYIYKITPTIRKYILLVVCCGGGMKSRVLSIEEEENLCVCWVVRKNFTVAGRERRSFSSPNRCRFLDRDFAECILMCCCFL